MIIQRARQLALRSPARVVFPDALDIRVLKAAHYLQQQGLNKAGFEKVFVLKEGIAGWSGENLPLVRGK